MLLWCEVLVNIQHGLVLPNLASCAREGEAAGRRRRGRKRAADRRKGGRGKGREGEREGAGAEGGDGTEGDVCSVCRVHRVRDLWEGGHIFFLFTN